MILYFNALLLSRYFKFNFYECNFYYFKTRNFRVILILRGFFNKFWISRHFIFEVQPKHYILRHFNFGVWPKYYDLRHFTFAVVFKTNFFLCVRVSDISKFSGKAWNLNVSLNYFHLFYNPLIHGSI